MYLLFGGSRIFPSGGMNDFLGSFASAQEAKDFLQASEKVPHGQRKLWAQIAVLNGHGLEMYLTADDDWNNGQIVWEVNLKSDHYKRQNLDRK